MRTKYTEESKYSVKFLAIKPPRINDSREVKAAKLPAGKEMKLLDYVKLCNSTKTRK